MEISGVGEQYFVPETVTRNKEIIEKEIKETNDRLEVIRTKGNELTDKLSESEQDELNDFAMSVFDNSEISAEEKNLMIEEKMGEYINNSEMAEAFGLFVSFYIEEDKLRQLQNEDLPFKVQETIDLATRVSSKLNFDQVMDYFGSKRNGNSDSMSTVFGELTLLRSVLTEGEAGNLGNGGFESVNMAMGALKKYEKEWEERGFFGEAQELNKQVNKMDLINEIEKVKVDLRQADKLLQTYRPRAELKNDDEFLRELGYALSDEDYVLRYVVNRNEETELDFDSRLLESVAKKIGEIKEQWKHEGKLVLNEEEKREYVESRRGDWETIFSKLKIKGLKEEEEKVLVVKDKELWKFLSGTFPSAFLKKIDSIEVLKEKVKDDGDSEGDESGNAIKTCGSYDPKYDNRSNLVGGKIFVYEPVHIDKDDKPEVKGVVEGSFKDTVAHEIGHGVHCDLSVNDLQAWNEVMDQDNVSITWYVGYSKGISEAKKQKEDFCESLMMFARDPSLLQILSKKRFDYMNNLFETYMDPANLENFRKSVSLNLELSNDYWERKGYTKEMVRNLYLK